MFFKLNNLNNFFSEKLEKLPCDKPTKAYIVGLLSDFKSNNNDLSKDSITLLFAEAKQTQEFMLFQTIGDWLFMCNALFPEHLSNASLEYYHSVGRLSYYSCFKLLNKQWVLFENLADNFVPLSEKTKSFIRKP
jgi:hypothetical protein